MMFKNSLKRLVLSFFIFGFIFLTTANLRAAVVSSSAQGGRSASSGFSTSDISDPSIAMGAQYWWDENRILHVLFITNETSDIEEVSAKASLNEQAEKTILEVIDISSRGSSSNCDLLTGREIQVSGNRGADLDFGQGDCDLRIYEFQIEAGDFSKEDSFYLGLDVLFEAGRLDSIYALINGLGTQTGNPNFEGIQTGDPAGSSLTGSGSNGGACSLSTHGAHADLKAVLFMMLMLLSVARIVSRWRARA